MKRIIVIPHIKVHNANALSSPYTIGFPAMTAWLGAAHALQRHVQEKGYSEFEVLSVAPICHGFDLQTFKGHGDYNYSIIGTGNPLDKNGKRPSFIEEARCHLEVSLILEYSSKLDVDEAAEVVKLIPSILHSKMKMASGDILNFDKPYLKMVSNQNEEKKLLLSFMPAHCLIERRDLMLSPEENDDALETLFSYLRVDHKCEIDEDEKVTWTSSRKTKGWIVPIATGFHAISELGFAKNQRDTETPHRFAESVVTLGEFIMPHRVESLDQILWHYYVDLENNLYLCQQNTQTAKN